MISKVFFASLMFLSSMPSHAFFWDGSLGNLEFPEERNYTSSDKGMGKYAAYSLHGTRQVVLTFDDGPSLAETPRLLDTLKKYNVKATFFVLGEKITDETIPVLVRALKEGHTIGAHSWAHENSTKQTEEEFVDSLKNTLMKIFEVQKLAGVNQREVYFRFPYGAYGYQQRYHHMNAIRELSYEMFGENCINFVFWNIDTEDWVSDMTPADITQNLIAQVDGGYGYVHKLVNGGFVKDPYNFSHPDAGGVALMHDIHPKTVSSLDGTLQEMYLKNIKVVPIQDVDEYAFGGKTCVLRDPTLLSATSGN